MPVSSTRRLALATLCLLLAAAISGCGGGERSTAERLDRDLVKALRTEGRVKCAAYLKDLWRCRVETDPGSGWSGGLTLRLQKDGCWRARHSRYAKGENWPYSRQSLSLGDSEAFGRTVHGCIELDR